VLIPLLPLLEEAFAGLEIGELNGDTVVDDGNGGNARCDKDTTTNVG
jgi:hypothetical protein